MIVQDLMTPSPDTCTPDTPIEAVARTMADENCGAVPVVESEGSNQPVGVVTDRDVTVRLVARGRNPLEATAADAMSEGAVTVRSEADLDEAARTMKDRQLRRLVVVDGGGAIVGILAQADLAREAADRQTGDVVEAISQNG